MYCKYSTTYKSAQEALPLPVPVKSYNYNKICRLVQQDTPRFVTGFGRYFLKSKISTFTDFFLTIHQRLKLKQFFTNKNIMLSKHLFLSGAVSGTEPVHKEKWLGFPLYYAYMYTCIIVCIAATASATSVP